MKAKKLKKTGACIEAIEYVQSCRNYRPVWNKCERGDWMLWIAKKIGIDNKILTHAKYLCANQVRHLMKDKRSIAALDACKDYVEGKITRKQLDADAAAAYAAAAAAAAAAYAAVDVAVDDDDAAAVQKESLEKSVDICREILTEAVFEIWDKRK